MLSHPSDLGIVARGIELSLHRSVIVFFLLFFLALRPHFVRRSVWKLEVGVLHSTAVVPTHSPVFDRNLGTVIRGGGGRGLVCFSPRESFTQHLISLPFLPPHLPALKFPERLVYSFRFIVIARDMQGPRYHIRAKQAFHTQISAWSALVWGLISRINMIKHLY